MSPPPLKADYQGGYALGCPLGRVIISKVAVREAKKHNCQVVAHGCTGKGNDQVRFEGYITALDPSLKIIAPVREWSMGREEEIDYALQHGCVLVPSCSSLLSFPYIVITIMIAFAHLLRFVWGGGAHSMQAFP